MYSTAGGIPCNGLASHSGGGGVAILLGMLYAKETRISLSDKISTEFHGILRVFVNFAGFRGFT